MSHARFLLAASLALFLAGCHADEAHAPPVTASASSQTQSAEAESTIDGTTVHISAVQTSQLPESVAREYGIERSPRAILLLVNLRDAGSAPAPVISATVTDLQQHTTPVALREVHVAQAGDGTTDYIGTVDATLPDTLRFTVLARRGGATSTVQVSRDFYPQ
ncbi:MAG: DUF4426 domain-containing protein [Lysobacter sp.]|nr:DUF4426 domain-containing protein [Lysobacter sp.]